METVCALLAVGVVLLSILCIAMYQDAVWAKSQCMDILKELDDDD
jgi:hypothetical protein